MSDGKSSTAQQDSDPEEGDSVYPRVEPAHAASHSSGRGSERPSTGRLPQGFPRREVRSVPSEAGNHLRGRHPKRVPEPRDLDPIEDHLVEALRARNIGDVWKASQKLLETARATLTEAARVRFEANYGTSVCNNCSGLKAGPGVVATCFQVRQCFYRNFTEKDLTPRQGRIADALGEDES